MTRPMHQDAAAAAVLRRIMVLLLLLLMFSLSSFSSVTTECPDKCKCVEEHIVDCNKQELNRIPDRISPATTLLRNKIRDIDPKSFTYLTQLNKLVLDNNKIRDIEPKLFTHLTELDSLWLDHNKISNLKIGAFANLSKLQILGLKNNEIENIETGVFNNLTSLELLLLDYNKIHKLDLEMFKGLTKLGDLSLSNNKIRTIPPGIFDSLTSLNSLNFNSNPLTCDCNMKLFANGLKKNHRYFFSQVYIRCYFPVEMREINMLKEIKKINIHCTSPDIIVVPENKTVLVGEQLQLSCKAVGDPEPSITWAKDDIDLELGQRVQVSQNNTLIISKVEKTDGGQYKCVASNPLGRKSFETMVNVNDKCPPLESDSLDIKCTHNGKYANCSNPSITGTIAKPLCKPLYNAPNGYENEPLELLCQSNGTWNKELYRCDPNCGKTYTINDGIIMGGKPAHSAGTAPWNVGVYRFNETISNNYDLICGGSIISPNLVVSAAHCFSEKGMSSNIISVDDVQYKIAVGKYSRNITIIDNEFTKIMNVETVYLNEYFYGHSGLLADDIAIVVLRNRISFSIGVSPICVDWTGKNTIPNGAEGKIVGWGKTEKGIASPILLEASLPYINHRSCRNMYDNGFERYVTKDKFCAGSALGQGVKEGDSGEGLSFLHSNNLYYLTGVASVKDTNTNSSIAVFTDVKQHIEFISRLCDNITYQHKCPPLESDSLDIKCTHNGKYANCSNPSITGTIAKPLCKPLYTAPNGYENEPLELLCQSNGTWNKELYRCDPNCGRTYTINDGIIMGGKPARSAGTAPWNVGVYRFETISNNYDLICGGSIISPNLVVSAAHCFSEKGMSSNIISVDDVQYKIAVGKYSRNITIIDNEFTKIMNVETVYLNEYYYGHSGFLADDIAIVVLRNTISFNIGVSPICVDWTGRNTIPNGAEGKIAGWGKTEKGIASPILLEASLPYINHRSCRKMYENGFESYVTKDKFCAGSASGQGVNGGDSGAGLSFLHSNNLYYLTGVASVKDPYTNSSIAVFTDVNRHIEFISRLYHYRKFQ